MAVTVQTDILFIQTSYKKEIKYPNDPMRSNQLLVCYILLPSLAQVEP